MSEPRLSGDFAWEHELEDMSLKTELERGYPQNTKEAVEELQAAFGDLEGMVVESRRSSRKDASDVLHCRQRGKLAGENWPPRHDLSRGDVGIGEGNRPTLHDPDGGG